MRPIATKFEHRLTATAWVLAAVATCALADVPANQSGKPQSQEVAKKPESAAGNPSTAAAEKVTKDGQAAKPASDEDADKVEKADVLGDQARLTFVLTDPEPISFSTGGGARRSDVPVGPFALGTLGSVTVSDGIRIGGTYTGLNFDNARSLGSPELRDFVSTSGTRIERGSLVDIFSATGAIEVYRSGPFTLSALGGVQGVSIDQPSRSDAMPPLTMTPVAGAGAEFRLARGLALGGRAMAGPRLGGAGEGSGDSTDMAVSLSTRWTISPSVSLEMEYQYSRIAAEAGNFSGQLRQEGVMVQLRLAF